MWYCINILFCIRNWPVTSTITMTFPIPTDGDGTVG